METTRIHLKAHQFFLMIMAAMMIVSFSSCATKTHFLSSSVVPAAEGTVKIKKDKNNNYNIGITLNNLAEANRLQPPRSTYVVWMEGENNETKNIGQIKSSHSMLSKKLTGSFHTVSAVKPKKILITAENDPSIQYPSNSNLVLTTDYIKR